ncbi:30S ribosomal protein S3 [Candidatus Giovannonibacteria bacterium RIFCSPLOWO2_01_FULL_43_160]|uniref:Small ribosomal subunit protein uS3 n=3 Tax=root TaxID=1 RepID=A0A0G1L4N9_9BACT|nr:30S ribosomal protein S3 [uncultured organism]KKS96548.1 MAG: 30S ribosomal protein S3 [Candidatus Giovannonibacteria bacterium GW2011_GWB1_43_13]KKS99851.1 MAG: 30S ribosomal protein S3 [Candidatus Giovannonibacteria bacterium GW2011_GWA1_43_15]KKT63552.1 MAG: 30S ribosomal protein S3 [Candidatus Giovannonibacteria bacterium GW2011_GWA2_44_26]OGF58574.1 MAG: 30S ribosomal protein S3 [Candidatus Giovannonibacteria bacterium RIFCSPHIGHO2_01_FULL_43_140]OGF69974.1 MAG: 30S ribosomal protein S
MTHTSHPYAMRLGIIRPWKSRWFSVKNYQKFLKEDVLLREHLEEKLRGMLVDAIEIERSPSTLNVIIKTARPGLLIGRGGEGIEKLKKEVDAFLKKKRKGLRQPADSPSKSSAKTGLKLTVEEIKSPEQHSRVMAETIAQDLEKRLPFRRVLKHTISKIMSSKGVKGAKITLSGRLDGAEMARYEWLKEGQIPLQTLRADVDFARGRAHLPYGDLGIKVWIYKGEIFNKEKDVATQKSKI